MPRNSTTYMRYGRAGVAAKVGKVGNASVKPAAVASQRRLSGRNSMDTVPFLSGRLEPEVRTAMRCRQEEHAGRRNSATDHDEAGLITEMKDENTGEEWPDCIAQTFQESVYAVDRALAESCNRL